MNKGKRMVFEEDIKYLQELKGENISSKTVGRVVDTNNITTLSDEVCNALKCGDMVNKVDSTGKHSYRVSYKKDKGGMCLTYSDASCVETVSYDYTASHWVYNSKDVTTIENMNKIEKIKDKSGHLRFIEGNISLQNITGLTGVYAKWSLSGTHLMIVIAGDIAANTTINDGTNLVLGLELPQWINNKIYLTTYGMNRIEIKTFNIYSGYNSSTANVALTKSAGGTINIVLGSITTTNNSSFRIQFDLLIDNED